MPQMQLSPGQSLRCVRQGQRFYWPPVSAPTLVRGSLAAAVNREYVTFDRPLSDGDEVVFIPPGERRLVRSTLGRI